MRCNEWKLTILTTLLFCSSIVAAQTSRFFIHFTDKNNTPYSISDPSAFLSVKAIQRRINQNIDVIERDLPVDPTYVDSINTIGANVLYTSKWMNAAYIEYDSSQINDIYSLDFVSYGYEAAKYGSSGAINEKSKLSTSGAKLNASQGTPDYGVTENGFELIGIDQMNSLGFYGNDLTIAVLDAGFRQADTISFLSHLFTNNQITSTYDFVDREINVYDNDAHGLSVLSIMAANKPSSVVGGIPEANYILLRTENETQETIAELVYWLIGAEYADSAGADIINSSLGYNEFDDSSQDFQYADLDGVTTLITQAATMASETGILVVTSAGNEGNTSWGKITAPADADMVLAVGAVDANGNYAPLSSRGPTFDLRIKPNVVAQGKSTGVGNVTGTAGFSNGTSFSAPQITALAAGLWEAIPDLTAQEVKEIIEKSGHQYETPDEYLGYGIPNFLTALNYGLSAKSGQVILTNSKIFPNPFHSGNIYLILGQQEVNKNVDLMVYNLKGQVLYKESLSEPEVSNKLTLDTNLLQEGMYFFKVVTSTGTYIHKLIKI